MQTLKEEAMSALATLPDSAEIDDIMYQIYVIGKIRKGQEAAKNGNTTTAEELREEAKEW